MAYSLSADSTDVGLYLTPGTKRKEVRRDERDGDGLWEEQAPVSTGGTDIDIVDSLHKTVDKLKSSFNNRLIRPRCLKEQHRKSLLPLSV